MAERRLGAPKLGGKVAPQIPGPKLTQHAPATKLGGKLAPYVPRGAQYDYSPPSVFARYKTLSAVFVILLVSLFGYWAFVLRQPRAAVQPAQHTQPAVQAPQRRPAQPPSDPVYVEPLPPR
jgi:hypothetical protein